MSATGHIPFVDLHIQYSMIQEKICQALQEVLLQGNIILGSQVELFEAAFSSFIGVRHAIGVSCGLDALRLALMALDIGAGQEVILPANTFIASALAISAVGARPVLVDCDPHTYNIDVNLIERAITPRTAAIMPIHFTGQPADMEPILSIARQYRLAVVEDAAQAHGALYKGSMCGSLGELGCFSFYPSKNLGAYGDGGMITTNDAALAHRLRMLRNYGQQSKNHHIEKGLNARLDTLQAAVLNVKLPYLLAWNSARAMIAEKYRSSLTGLGDVSFQHCLPHSTHVYHLFIVETRMRSALQEHLQAHGVQTGIHYPTPIHLQPAFMELGYKRGDFPQSERLANEMLSLPMYAELNDDQLHYIVDAMTIFFQDQLVSRHA
jgi:dTDP-4-amino-4,6-dideoxygalactose transaminase